MTELAPLSPNEAVEWYLTDRCEDGLAEATLQSHGYRLQNWKDWCEEEGTDNMNNVTGRDVQQFKMHRSREVSNVTLKSQMDTLRVFLRFCESIDACIDDLAECVNSPSLSDGEGRGTDVLRTDRAEEILAYLSKYKYASIHHTLFPTLMGIGHANGAARSIDLPEVNLRNEYIELHHRPESKTLLRTIGTIASRSSTTRGSNGSSLLTRPIKLIERCPILSHFRT